MARPSGKRLANARVERLRRSGGYSAKVWPARLPLGQAGCDLLARV
jgi:hypothetical protein